MGNERSVNFGRDGVGNVITTGDANVVEASTTAKASNAVDPELTKVIAGLAEIRAILEGLQTEDAGKIHRALEDAEDETKKPAPDKAEVGNALERALKYAQKSAAFATVLTSLAPRLSVAVTWLGGQWSHLLKLVSGA
jgi:hypothetical protein